MKYRVYRNLHKPGKLSVQHYVKGVGWRLVGHVENIILSDAVFKVSAAGRERVLRTGRKNVHAFIVGDYRTPVDTTGITRAVTYNPRKYESFVDRETLTPVHRASVVEVHGDGAIWARM